MKLVVIAMYRDLELKRIVQPGEILEVSQKRGEVILDKGYAVATPETSPKAEVKKAAVPKKEPTAKTAPELVPERQKKRKLVEAKGAKE